MSWIDYTQLPPSVGGYSSLFFDFLANADGARPFYRLNFRENSSFESVLREQQERRRDRVALTTVLREQNQTYLASKKTLEHIAALENPATFAVVTGQQVGIFGGPLYTILKTLTTIRLAQRLKEKYPLFSFVPVFWLEGEDHDFAEMHHAQVLDNSGGVARIEYLPGGSLPDRNPGPVGEFRFDAAIETTLAGLKTALQETEFTSPLLESLRACYSAGTSFNEAFARWLNKLFPDDGIVFISANNPALKKLLSPLFLREVTEYPASSQIVIGQSAELEKTYHAQVKPKSVNLFLFHKGGRYPIEPREHDFSLRGTRHFLEPDELARIATETPEELSPNVILRPLAQDTLLPTIAYVAGPSEIAYHAQLAPLYGHFGIPQPLLFPRASVTVVEERVQRALEKYGLRLEDLFGDQSVLTNRVMEQISEVKLDDLFQRTTKGIHGLLTELRFGLKELDPTLLGALENATSKIDINLGVLKEKSIAAQKRRNETAVRQIERSVGSVLPGGVLQERQLSVVYFLNKYGPDFMKWLSGEVDITGFKHQVLSL
ncbi:MAG: bacillithiol biosynthesis cysteine-adding enzyme BshC [Bacteroidetes bacterium]|nr:bacillithiol biosynthesis cysteine-adding enzyme BshC [Bacteroidota bacterium]